MSIRCPACGFESPDNSKWCDFCKESFVRKPKPDDVIKPVDDEAIRKALAEDRLTVVAFSPLARNLAIGFLGFMLFCALVMAVLLLTTVRTYNGPGKEYELGKPQVVPVSKNR